MSEPASETKLPPPYEGKGPLHCSFCLKSAGSVAKMIGGPGVFIYDPQPGSAPLAFTRHVVEDGGVGTVMFAQDGYESGGIGDGAEDDISNRFTAAFRKSGSAISGKTVDIEHPGSPPAGLRLIG